MELDGDAARAYWSVIAQIVPVIALTLVLETRSLTQRWQDDAWRKRKAIRWIMGMVILLLAIGLPSTFITALWSIATGESEPFNFWWSLIWSATALLLVAYVPMMEGIQIALTDMFLAIDDRLPWGERARGLRERRRLVEMADQILRYSRAQRLKRWGVYTEFAIFRARAEATIDADDTLTPSRRRELAELAAEQAKFRDDLIRDRELDALLAEKINEVRGLQTNSEKRAKYAEGLRQAMHKRRVIA